MAHPVRGTQTLVDQMGWVFRHPLLSVMEVAWRWCFGVPFLLVCGWQARQIVRALPLVETGFNNVDTQNPWVAVVQLAGVWTHYRPHVAVVLEWLLPLAAVVWAIFSGLGRSLVLKRMNIGVRMRPLAMIGLQAVWLVLIGLTFWCWFRAIQWVAARYITPDGNADLIGYSIWAIFLSLAFFSLWAFVSWPATMAPLLMLLEERTPVNALAQSFRLGKVFTGKLMEINLVMGIVKLMLMVLALVFSAAPLPFSDQLGSDALHVVMAGAALFYLVANDYFQVVRLKSFVEFWRTYRGQHVS